MMVGLLFLLLCVQSLKVSASEITWKWKVCGSDHIAYTSYPDGGVLLVNGNILDGNLYCEVLRFYHENDCFFEGYPDISHCGLNLKQVGSMHIGGRKLLEEKEPKGKPSVEDPKTQEKTILSTPGKIAVALGGAFAAFCILICPCFFRRRRPTAHTVLPKDANSIDSASSYDGSSSVKVPASPFRGAASPPRLPALRVPGSPLRVPPSPRFSTSPRLTRAGSIHLNVSQVYRATQNFSSLLRIGKGGYGTVYKAQLDDGQVVAIKRAKREHFKGLQSEFNTEVELLSKIEHRNLVKLLGYVDKGDERFIITEYVPNGTLRDHLDGRRDRILDFNQRLEIAIDVAHGLTYLHLYSEKQIIHRDVKSTNILLTDSMRAKVADFGFARIGSESGQTHVSTNVKGTVGYLDPEYMRTFQLTTKSDVYSFGVLLLEILTGRRPVEMKRPYEERVTPIWAFRKFDQGRVAELVDPMMEEVVDIKILTRIFAVGIQCVAPVRNDRPDMKLVGEELWSIRADYIRGGRTGS